MIYSIEKFSDAQQETEGREEGEGRVEICCTEYVLPPGLMSLRILTSDSTSDSVCIGSINLSLIFKPHTFLSLRLIFTAVRSSCTTPISSQPGHQTAFRKPHHEHHHLSLPLHPVPLSRLSHLPLTSFFLSRTSSSPTLLFLLTSTKHPDYAPHASTRLRDLRQPADSPSLNLSRD